MSNENKYVPKTTEEKREYAKQFTKGEIESYRKGQQSAYSHMSNSARRHSFFIYNNLKKDGQEQGQTQNFPTPPPAKQQSFFGGKEPKQPKKAKAS